MQGKLHLITYFAFRVVTPDRIIFYFTIIKQYNEPGTKESDTLPGTGGIE
jgi:hypothetical protein